MTKPIQHLEPGTYIPLLIGINPQRRPTVDNSYALIVHQRERRHLFLEFELDPQHSDTFRISLFANNLSLLACVVRVSCYPAVAGRYLEVAAAVLTHVRNDPYPPTHRLTRPPTKQPNDHVPQVYSSTYGSTYRRNSCGILSANWKRMLCWYD